MVKEDKSLLVLLSISVFFAFIWGYPWVQSGDPIHLRVVDAKTNQPIEGVHVVANWELNSGLEGGNVAGQLQVLEAISDKDGKIYFPEWGPKLIYYGHLHNSPHLNFYKPGYKWQMKRNEYDNVKNKKFHIKSDWDGKTISLEKLEGTPEERLNELKEIYHRIYFMTYRESGSCNWANLGSLLMATNKERIELKRLGYKKSMLAFDRKLLSNRDHFIEQCGEEGKRLIEALEK